MESPGIVGSPKTPKMPEKGSPLHGTIPLEDTSLPLQNKNMDILKDVIAYVEVRSGSDNRGRCITKMLVQLGAQVLPKFTNEVTHVVFKDGKKSTLDKAKKKGVHLVSVLWVDSCKLSETRVDEKLHEPALAESMMTPILIGRHLKKTKSMQPKDFDEEVASSAERGKNRRRRQANVDKWKILETPYSPQLPRTILAVETQPQSPYSMDMTFSPLIVPETPASMRRKLEELRQKQAPLDEVAISSSDTPNTTDNLTPLQRRLFQSNLSGMHSDLDSPDLQDNPHKSGPSKVDHGSEPSDDRSSSNGGKKKHKLFNVETGALPPENLVQPTKSTNRMQTKPMILSPKVIRKKGPRARAPKRTRSEDVKILESSSFSIEATNAPSKGDISEERPKKRSRTSKNETSETAPTEQTNSKTVDTAAISKLKRNNRRQSVASSTPSKNTSLDLPKKRGRKSMALVPPPLSPSPATDHVPKSASPKKRGRRSLVYLSPLKMPATLSNPVAAAIPPNASNLGLDDRVNSSPKASGPKKRGRKSLLSPHTSSNMTPGYVNSEVIETPTTGDIYGNMLSNDASDKQKPRPRGRPPKSPKKSLSNLELTPTRPVTTPTDIDATTVASALDVSLDSGPQIKRRGRRSMAAQKSIQENSISPQVPSISPFDETSEQNTVIKNSLTSVPENSISDQTGAIPSDQTATKLSTKVNRRRSVRIQNISVFHSFADEPSLTPATPEARAPRRSILKSTPASEYGSQGKCPADLDSTADDSVLCLLQKKKAFKSVSSARKPVNFKGRIGGISSLNDNSQSIPESGGASNNRAFACLAHSRRSLEEFHPSQFMPKTSKKTNYDNNFSDSASDDSTSKVKRKVKKNPRARPSRCSSSSGEESGSKESSHGTGPRIATTSMHFDEQDVLRSIIDTLKGYRLGSTVKDNTSHVICGDARRTLTVLYAISRGCWLLSKEWVLESLEAGKWIDEEAFEMHDYFPAAQAARLERQTCESEKYCSGIFSGSGHILVADQTVPPHHHLVSFIKLNGGKVTSCARKADVCVGSVTYTDKPNVTEQWVLDSITSHRCLPLDNYRCVDKDRQERASSPVF